MAFQLEHVSSNLMLVEWKTSFNQVSDSKLTTEYFQIERSNPFISYDVGCSLHIKPVTNQSEILAYSVGLSLRWKTSTSKQSSSFDPAIHHHPRTISVSLGGGDERKLKFAASRILDRGFWEADEFVINSQNLSNKGDKLILLMFKISIEFEPNFNNREKNVLNELADLFVKQEGCDVKFYFNGNQKIGGHTSILSARSSVFKQVTKTSKIIQVEDDVEPNIFEQFLYYIYSGRTSKPFTEERAQALYKLADKYSVNDLKEDCVDFLISSFRPDNVLRLMAWADFQSIEKLKKEARSFKDSHIREIASVTTKTEKMDNTQMAPPPQPVASCSSVRPSTSASTPPNVCGCVMCDSSTPTLNQVTMLFDL